MRNHDLHGFRWQTLVCTVAWLLILSSLMCYSRGNADTNLAVICTAGVTQGQAASAGTCTATKYATPKPGDFVRVGASWSNYVMKEWTTLSPVDTYEVCTTDIPNPTAQPLPWTAAADACKAWIVVTKAATAVVNTTGNIVLTWTLPTQNTDNTPLTDLAGVWIYSGSPLTRLKQIAKPAGTTTLTGYKDGTYQFAMTAITTAGVESAQVGPVSVTVKIPPVVIIPNPPTALTVVEATAYRYDQGQVDKPRLFAVGTVPLKTACDAKYPVLGLYRVQRSAVTFTQGASANIPLAKCG